jgi:putative toxin-antitoxin system antitoxin component (TIGR02293 family)
MKTATVARKAQGKPAQASTLIEQVRRGLPIAELTALQGGLQVPLEQLASKLAISRATLQRRKASGRLSPDESDKLLRFSRLLSQATDIFGDATKAREWLKLPQRGLGGAVPLEYAETEIGAREVENLLGRIDYGVYA